MFTTVIGKKCLQNPECNLHGQMQDAGLPLCVECTCELTVIKRISRRAVLAASVAALLLTSASSVFGYGVFVQQFTAGQTVKWLAGKLKRVNRLDLGNDMLLSGDVSWWNPDGTARQSRTNYLYERVNSQHRFRPEFTVDRNEWLRFDLTPRTEYAYIIYRGADKPQVLFSSQGGALSGQSIQVPQSEAKAIRLAGPTATEHFILIASRRPIPAISAPKGMGSTERIDQIVADLENDPDNALVYHLMIPHK